MAIEFPSVILRKTRDRLEKDIRGYIDRIRTMEDEADLKTLRNGRDLEGGKAKFEREYVFVDFNAWQFAGSDQLWAGLIRNLLRLFCCLL